MEYKILPLGSMGTNCYLAWCPESKEALVIDPGFEPQTVLREIEALGLKVKYIVNTHGHMDHIGGNQELHSALGAPIAIGSEDAFMLTDASYNLSSMMRKPVLSPAPQVLLQEGDSLDFGACSLQVLSTPGHTPGGISLYGHGLLFCGDTLFKQSIGRSDLPGGDHCQLIQAIQAKLLPLPGETKVLPGHGPISTLAKEKVGNPWLQG
jgi:glyoxylase-like metal-dependent hydrolase (beta-lactamase superfamily II)